MEIVLVVFDNRNHAFQFASSLKRLGIGVKVVNTPRELSLSCGVSVEIVSKALAHARIVVERMRISTPVRFYLVRGDFLKKYIC